LVRERRAQSQGVTAVVVVAVSAAATAAASSAVKMIPLAAVPVDEPLLAKKDLE